MLQPKQLLLYTLLAVSPTAFAGKGDVGNLDTYLSITFSPTVTIGLAIKLTSDVDLLKRVIVRAKDDASVYIATEGKECGSYLQAAFKQLRQTDKLKTNSDLELAQLILINAL